AVFHKAQDHDRQNHDHDDFLVHLVPPMKVSALRLNPPLLAFPWGSPGDKYIDNLWKFLRIMTRETVFWGCREKAGSWKLMPVPIDGTRFRGWGQG
ncbi:MAG: hypothetical protein PVG85_03460, partial [Deltaproteobacteria bacterium]